MSVFETSSKLLQRLPSFIRRQSQKRPNVLKILENMGWLFFDHLLRVVLGLLVGVWIARYLGPEKFGIFNFATSFVTLFGAFATLGLNDIVIRDIVKEPSAKEEILGTAFWLKFWGGVLVVLASIGLINVLRPDDLLIHWLVAIAALAKIFQSLYVIDFWFQSQVQSKFTVWSKSVSYLITNLFKIAAVVLRAPLIIFGIAILIETVLNSIGLIINYRSRGHSLRAWRPSLKRAKDLLRDSWPLMISTVMILIYSRIDIVMLGQMVGNEAVGLYTSVSRLLDYTHFIPVVLISSLFPSLVRSKERGENIYLQRLQRLYDANTALAYLMIAVSLPLAPFIIGTLYGSEYAGATSIFVVYIWASIFNFMGIARGRQLVNDGLMKFALTSSALGVVINVGLNLVLIPTQQGVGAAVATVAAQIASGYLSSLLLLPQNNVWVLQTKALLAPFRYGFMLLRMASRP